MKMKLRDLTYTREIVLRNGQPCQRIVVYERDGSVREILESGTHSFEQLARQARRNLDASRGVLPGGPGTAMLLRQ